MSEQFKVYLFVLVISAFGLGISSLFLYAISKNSTEPMDTNVPIRLGGTATLCSLGVLYSIFKLLLS